MASQVNLPKLTYEMEEGHILEWLCQEGEEVAVGQPLFVVETDKATVEVPAEQAGTLLKILVPAGDTVPVSTVVAWTGTPGEELPETAEAPAPIVPVATGPAQMAAPPPPQSPAALKEPVRVAASPVAKRLARELGVDLTALQEQLGNKRIREADVRAFAETQTTEPAAQPPPAGDAGFELLEPTPLGRTMAAHLTPAAAIPQSVAACQVNLTHLKSLRNELLPGWEAIHGWRLSYTHMLAALIARVLESCPLLNASWTEEGIRLYRTVNLGVAMATDRGLVVPVVQNAGQRSLAEIGSEIVRLQQATARNRLLPTDLQGGTFTMTNVGMLGIQLSIPLLNPPQSAILGIGAEDSKVVLRDNKLWSIPVAWFTVTSDHRVVDGAAAAEFLQQVKGLVETPSAILS
jgi:pyruvate dehydrogenase E2 component (dihydrolipoamide acetyltransferase)